MQTHVKITQEFIAGDIKESVGISLLSIRKMGPPLEALSPPDAFGRSGEETPGRFWTRGV